MWWPDDEPRLAGEIERVLGAWRREMLTEVVAVGSTWTKGDERILFVGIDAARDPRASQWAPGPTLFDAAARVLIRRFGPLPSLAGSERKARDRLRGMRSLANLATVIAELLRLHSLRDPSQVEGLVTVSLDEADPQTRSELQQLDLSPATRIGYLGPIRLVGHAGTRLHRRTRETATVGCLILVNGGALLTTAGHLGARIGEKLFFRVRRQLFKYRREAAGDVFKSTSPTDPDQRVPTARGVDLAVIFCEGRIPDRTLHPVVRADPRQIRRTQEVRWNGGEAGPRVGWVAHLAAEFGDRDHPHVNSFLVNGPRTGAATEGDSGTAVYTLAGELIGYVVATEGYRFRSFRQSAVVQDAGIGFDYLEHFIGPIHEIHGDGGL